MGPCERASDYDDVERTGSCSVGEAVDARAQIMRQFGGEVVDDEGGDFDYEAKLVAHIG